jgi:hypothetical protein
MVSYKKLLSIAAIVAPVVATNCKVEVIHDGSGQVVASACIPGGSGAALSSPARKLRFLVETSESCGMSLNPTRDGYSLRSGGQC